MTLASCATLPPPTGELAAAQQAVGRAAQADAEQYAQAEFAAAQAELSQAQAALSAGRDDDARRLALLAEADAALAVARSRAAVAAAAHAQREREVAELQSRLQLDADAPAALPGAPADAYGNYAGRLQALVADPRLSGLAELERARAQQAIDELAVARAKQRPAAEALAERRVRAAELAAYAQALQRDNDRLERTHSELQLEATRREAAAARAEADRLRMEAQMRAEETERLRQQAADQEQARLQAEQALQGAATQQAAKAGAAREKELSLAREEAELVAGAKLPPVRRDARGEVFTLAGDAFASGQATLTAKAAASLKALAHYIDVARAAGVRVDGYTDNQGAPEANQALSQRRADAVRQALVAGGAGDVRIDVAGHGAGTPVADNGTAAGRAKNRRVEVVVTQK
ncbi:OmpA family protein [Cognatilysobacter segetis]|uniref:OmpA family protein n=1 Tax=Cognatilysobacter segetis TaxID=2492394 RepID=UPI00139023F9|nr:OmpA family protein [Lysobacter segetis]